MRPMKAVSSPRHRGHDVTHETFLGIAEPANEVVERAERIRTALEADRGFEIVAPTDHGLDPLLAVHDAGLIRFVEEAWAGLEAEGLERTFLIGDTYPVRAMFEGLSPDALATRPEPRSVTGRVGYWGLDSANPIVAGTYDAARSAVDVALTAADLVIDGGERMAYGLCR